MDRRKLDAVRDATLTVRRRRRAPFHWYTELDLSRTAMVDHIAAHTDLQLAVVSRPVARHRHERARARCLTSLLTQIQVLDPPVREVVLESRTDVLDKRDTARVDGLRAPRRLRPDLRFSFGTKAEPLLWLADAVAGAISADLRGEPRYAATLADHLIRISIPGVP